MGKITIDVDFDSKGFSKGADEVKSKAKEVEASLEGIAVKAGIAFAAFTAGVGFAVSAFAKFETGLVGVGKTTGIAGKELLDFGNEIKKISSRIPVATEELLRIAQSAGQLGVTGSKNILKFAETIAKLGRASDLHGEAAAATLTRILNVTGDGVGTIDTFAAVIVRLGNSFAASESEIAEVTQRVAKATTVFKIGATNAVAIATALKALSVQAQLGGSVVGRAFNAIDKAIRKGGKALRDLRKITGLTGVQLKKTFKDDATEVFRRFVGGLSKIAAAGGSTSEALEKLGLSGTGVDQVFGGLIIGSETLNRALITANDEAKIATALNIEFAAASKTLASTIQVLTNNVTLVSQAIGFRLAPLIDFLAKKFSTLFRFIQRNPVFADLAALVLLLGVVLAGLVTGLALTGIAFIKIHTAAVLAQVSLSGLSLAFVRTKAAALVARAAIFLLSLSVGTFVSATGIGAILIITGLIIANWETVWPAMQVIFQTFAKNITNLLLGLGKLLTGALTFDISQLQEGFNEVKAELEKSIGEIKDNLSKDGSDALSKALSPDSEIIKEKNQAARDAMRREAELNNAALLVESEITRELKIEIAERDFESDEERQAALAEVDTERFQQKIARVEDESLTEAQIIAQIELDKIKKQKKADEDFIRDREKTGAVLAVLNKVLQNETVQGINQGTKELAKLTRSRNSTLKTIGKIGAVAQITLQTAVSASNVLVGFSTIPFVGATLGFIAAAAVIAFGAEQISNALAAQKGGVVPGIAGIPGGFTDRDSIPAVLSPGELIVPRQNFDEVIEAVAATRGAELDEDEDEVSGGSMVIIGFDGDEASQVLTARQIEDSSLGISEAG